MSISYSIAPKYRGKVIYGELKADIGKILRKLCNEKKVEIIEVEACPDHIHMLVSIPPHMSISQFMGYIKSNSHSRPKWLSLSIVCILKTLIKEKVGQIMLDGKAIKSTDAIRTIEPMMNIVTAYTDTGISMGQITVDSKSNEIPAVRELIEMLNIEGTVVTADAMHCQKETAEIIVKNKGDYVLQLKANQKGSYEDVYAMFDNKYINETDTECEYEIYRTQEKYIIN